jgi:hypothetical protein
MGVVQCCFAGIGTQLFGHVRRGQPGGITRSVNFETFGNSMLILFQCMTSALRDRSSSMSTAFLFDATR